MEGFVTTVIVFCVLIAAILKMGVKIVSQSEILIIERLGRFHKVLDGGFHIIVPFFDAVRAKMSVREQLVDISKQQVITKDNVNISVDGIVFLKVIDGKMALYNVEDYRRAISNLAMTTLRSAIGEMSLDNTLSSRDQLNSKLQIALGDAADNWGVKIMRVEISEISVPHGIEEAMNMQMSASSFAAEYLLAQGRVNAFSELSKNPSKDKILIPYETSELIGSLSVLKEFLGKNGAKELK